MTVRLSRHKIAHYVSDRLVAGDPKAGVLQAVAGYLIATGRTRELELLVRDIEEALAERGTVVADVTSAYPLTDQLRVGITGLMGGAKLQLREVVDKAALGGIRIDLPGRRFDGTIQHKLTALRAKKL